MSGLHMLHSSWNYSDWRFCLNWRRRIKWCKTWVCINITLIKWLYLQITEESIGRITVFDWNWELTELVLFFLFYLLVFCSSRCSQSCIKNKSVCFFYPNVCVAPGNSSCRPTLPELNDPIKYLHSYYGVLFCDWMDKWTFTPPLKIPSDHTGLQRMRSLHDTVPDQTITPHY